MSITYGVVKESYILDGVSRKAYGLVAYADAELDGTATIVASARDLTENRERIEAFARRCNEGKISLVHFDDVVEDFLSE